VSASQYARSTVEVDELRSDCSKRSLLSQALEVSEYDPEKFPGLIYRIKEPKTALLLFGSGKAICTGGKSLNDVRESVDIVADKLLKAGIPVERHPEITVQNIVATSDLGAGINLANIAISLGVEHIEYEPEQFPGLVYRLEDPKVVCLLFGTGKMVLSRSGFL